MQARINHLYSFTIEGIEEGKTWQEHCLPWLAQSKRTVCSRICHLEKVLLVRALAREARILPQINLILNTHYPAAILM